MTTQKKAIIIGSGVAGLASAIRLSAKGYSVHVFESNSYPGGKLTTLQLGKYRFDAGPSLFTLPHLVDELFELTGKDSRAYFEYSTVSTACHYFFEDGTKLQFSADKEQLLKHVSEELQVDPEPLRLHFEKSQFIFERTKSAFLERSLHRWQSYLSVDILKAIIAIPRLGIFSTMHRENERCLNHPKLVQIFDRYATYNGSNPYQAPGILNIIPHLEHGIGTYFPKEGMHGITKALVKLAEDLGVQFFFNQRVQEIIEQGGRVKGIRLNDRDEYAHVVICNSDVKPAYRKLLKNVKAPEKTMKQEPSSSAMIFYWGVKASFPELDLHNIFFSEDYQAEFDCIFKKGIVSADPTVYVHVGSKYVSKDAPEGCESWFILVNVPSNNGQDWETLRNQIRQNVLDKLSRMLGKDIEGLIEEEDYLDPVRIEQRTSSHAGALYGASSNDRMAAFFRHPNFSKIKGLYFVGGSVHPGGGIPLCLLSSKIAIELIED
jgi:phytoene desaturase